MTDDSNNVEQQRPLPLQICPGMATLGFFIVSDRQGEFVAEFETYDEAIAFVAKAHGTDVETVDRKTAEHGRLLGEYMYNVRRGIKPNQDQ